MPKLTEALRAEYQRLFDTCQIRPERIAEVEAAVVKIVGSKARYQAIGQPSGVPWYVIGVLHSLEAGSRFDRHLHNGDPLTARTVQVPKNRPPGNPPFTFEQSAADALAFEGYTSWTDWSVPGILFKWESYNGWGYRAFHPEVLTPYLWSYTLHYTRGKYVADGTFSASAVSKQTGAAALLRRLAEKGEMDAESVVNEPPLFEVVKKSAGGLRWNPNKVQAGGVELQQFLNRFPGIFLREDGKLGDKTSDACKKVFGQFLAGDPRQA